MPIGTKMNPATKFVEGQMPNESVVDVAARNRLVAKEVQLDLKQLKNNMLLAVPVELFAGAATLFKANGEFMSTKEEPVYRVVMVGDKTDDYLMDIKVGDLVIISNAAGFVHASATRVKASNGETLEYYYLIAFTDVILKVGYALLPKINLPSIDKK